MNQEEDKPLEPAVEQVETRYRRLGDRFRAAVTDGLVLLGLIIVAGIGFSFFDNAPDESRMVVFVIIFVLYDPLLVHFTGGTYGHHHWGLRVKRLNNEEKNVNLILAFIRFFTKAGLGWISFLSMISSKKKLALHDMLVGSVVVYK